MSAFITRTLTTAGIDVMTKTVAGGTLEFTKIRVGDGALGTETPAARTALVHSLIEVPITFVKVTGAGTATAEGTFTNDGRTTGFFYREIGLFAKDPVTKKEVLFAYGNAGDQAEWIPPSGESTVVEKIIQIDTLIGNATKVSAQLKSGIYITNDALAEKLAPYALKTEVTPKADDTAVVHKAGTETVTGAKTFSAQITANGGVKGNLTGTASKATADASGNTITSTYATKTENATKANDNAVVHLAGAENVTGTKSFLTDIVLKDTKNDITTTAADTWANNRLSFYDKNNARYCNVQPFLNSDGGVDLRVYIVNKSGTEKRILLLRNDKNGNEKGYIGTNEILTPATGMDLASAQTVTGAKTFTGVTTLGTVKMTASIGRNVDNSNLVLSGGTLWDKGAYLALYGKDNASKGKFDLGAKDGTNSSTLSGTATGALSWGNNTVLTTANGCDLASAQIVTGRKKFTGWQYFTGINAKYLTGETAQKGLYLFGGMNASLQGTGAQLKLYTETFNGGFQLLANSGTATKSLTGDSNGALSWGGNTVLTTANGLPLSGGTMTGSIYFRRSADAKGSATIYKNHSATNDCGLTLLDTNANGSYSSVVIGNGTGGLDSKIKLCVDNTNYNLYGGHNSTVVIASWKNGYSWYRLWSDGFVEQGGRAECSENTTKVTFFVPFINTYYTPTITEESPTNTWNNGITEKQTTSMTLKTRDVPAVYWYACGKR